MNRSFNLYGSAVELVSRLQGQGFVAYFAGGCVRDMVMKNDPADYDIATSATPVQIMGMFKNTIPIGVSFGVVNVILNGFQFEVATFRSDGTYSDGRRPDSVSFCDAYGDVRRRDFTINGMLYDPVGKKIIDYVGGKKDIERKIIRTIGDPLDRFNEDHLRLIRGVRFAARFSFDIDSDTKVATKKLAGQILNISVERICDEFQKGLTSVKPHIFIKMLDESGLLKVIMPEVCEMKNVEQPENFHPEGDVFVHTLLALSKLDTPSWELSMGTLLHDVAKPVTFSRDIEPDGTVGRIRFTQHDNIGARMAGKICRRLRTSKYSCERIMWLVRKHLCIKDVPNMRKSTLKRLFAEPGYLELCELFRVDTLASIKDLTNYNFFIKKFDELSNEQVNPKPLVNGNDLIAMGLEPGPVFSKILSKVMDEQLEETVASREEALALTKELVSKEGAVDLGGQD